MFRRRFLATVTTALVGLSACASAAVAETADPTQGVTIALIDSGINPAHQEFEPGQLVGYWDFTTSSAPKAGERFDPENEPADDNGHGTLASSLAAGLNMGATQTPSFAPGFRFAMADVVAGNTVTGDVSAAIRWAVRTIKADVISISIDSLAPTPGAPLLFEEYAALEEAYEAGVFITVGNGDGLGDLGMVPGDGASSTYSSSQDVLAVGAAGMQGAQSSYHPEVAAQYTVTGPARGSTDRYQNASGTSFSSALAAGFAARLIAEARSVGTVLEATDLQWLIKYTATDTDQPPIWEGYGILDDPALAIALGHIRKDTWPAYNDLTGVYVEEVANHERALNAGEPRLPFSCTARSAMC